RDAGDLQQLPDDDGGGLAFIAMRERDGLPGLASWHLLHSGAQLVAELCGSELQAAEARRRVSVRSALGEQTHDAVRGCRPTELALSLPPQRGQGGAIITGDSGVEHVLRLRHGRARVVQRLLLARLEQVVA